MRKSSKLLAVLLTLCLLFGAITAIFASATEENPLKVTDVSLTSTEANTYEEAFTWVANSNYTSEYDLKNFDYVTLDFDFASETVLPTELQLKAVLGTYADDAALEAGTNKTDTSGAFVIFEHEGAHYVGNYSKGTSANNTTENGKLEKVDGAYDHITLVWQIVKSEGAVTGINQSLYVNGNFINTTVKKFTVTTPYNYFYGISGGAFKDASVTIKNTAINHYATGAENTAALKTLSTAKSALYTSDVVVYNATYAVPGATGYVQVGDVKTYIPGAASAVIAENLENNGVVTVSGANVANVTIPGDITAFSVELEDDATFALSEETDALYMAFETADGMSYTKLRENVYEKGDHHFSKGNYTTPAMSGGAPTASGNVNVGFSSTAANKYVATEELSQYKYVTIDYDFAFTTDEMCNLRFPVNAASLDTLPTGNYASGDHKAAATFNITEREDGCYVGDVKLSSVKDVYDHFTILVAVDDQETGVILTIYVYVNGELAYTSEPYTCAKTYSALSRLGMQYPTAADRLTTSTAAKNFNLNFYEESAAIDSVIAGAPLYTADDVVYNKDFVTLNKNTYAVVNGYPYYVVNAAFANLAENETITVYNVGNGYQLPSSFNLSRFTIAVGAGEFSLAADDAAKYETTPVAGNGYMYTKVRVTELDYTTNDSVLYAEDFTSKKGADSHTLSNSAVGVACENGTKAAGIQASYITANGNTYARVHANTAAAQTNRTGNFALRAQNVLADRFRDFSYVTFDFDISADQYAYAYGAREVETQKNGTATGKVTAPYYKTAASDAEFEAYIDSLNLTDDVKAQYKAEGIASKALAYPHDNSLAFSLFYNCEGPDGNWKTTSTDKYRVVVGKHVWICQNEDGVWYACKARNDFEGAVQLSNKVGVFDHVSVVMKVTIIDAEKYTVTPYYYVNGELLNVGAGNEMAKASFNMMYVDGMYGDKVRNPADKHDDKYSIAFDNIALNYYTADDLANTTLDETVAAGAPLYTATNVVYNAGYVTPNKDRYATVGSDDFKYYVLNAAFNELVGGESIYLYNVGKYALPAGFEVNEFYAELVQGTYDYSADDAVRYTITKDGNTYTFSLNRSYVKVNGVEYTLEEALEVLAALKDSKDQVTIYLLRTNLVDYKAELANFTVTCGEDATFTLSADCAWRYAKVGDAYIRAIDGDVMANVTLFADSFRFNLYIPYNEALAYAGGYSGATWAADKYLYDGGIFTYNGVDYIRIYWNVRHDLWNKEFKAKFTYTVDEVTYTLEDMLYADFNALEYATIVAGKAECGSEDAELMKAMVDYKIAFKTAAKGTYSKSTAEKKFYEKYEAHADYNAETGLCSCSNVTPENTTYITVGEAQNSEYKDEVSLAISADGRNIYLQVDAAAINADANYVTVAYLNVENKPSSKSGTVANGIANISGMSATNIDNVLTVKLYKTTVVGEGEEAETNYELLTEFNYSLADMTTTTDNDAALLAALKAYAIAAENYKKYIPAN